MCTITKGGENETRWRLANKEHAVPKRTAYLIAVKIVTKFLAALSVPDDTKTKIKLPLKEK